MPTRDEAMAMGALMDLIHDRLTEAGIRCPYPVCCSDLAIAVWADGWRRVDFPQEAGDE